MRLDPTILAFDTTGTEDSLSLYHKGEVTSKTLPKGGSRLQSSILVPSLQMLLQSKDLTFKDVTVLATLSGPGSFTGIRIGLATAQGLLIAGNYHPVIPTLPELLAFSASREGSTTAEITSIIDSKRGDYFCQTFTKDLTAVHEAQILTLAEIKALSRSTLLVSDKTIEELPDLYIPKNSVAGLLIAFCLHHALKGDKGHYRQAVPFYIRNPEFKKQKRFT